MVAVFAISGQGAVYGERIAIALGLGTTVMGLAVFISCRTFVSLLSQAGTMRGLRSRAYQTFSGYHVYYWWFFGVCVTSHVMMASFHTGLPQPGDPDAGAHWLILSLGAVGALSVLAVLFSCRLSRRLLAPTVSALSFASKPYRSFFKYHSHYWWILVVLVAAHFATSYLHAGVWPGAG